MANKFTYHQLAERLRELGYTDSQTTLNGKPVWLFENSRHKNATIFLPPMPLEQPVESMHLNGVRATLRVHGIIREQPEGFLFPSSNGNQPAKQTRNAPARES
jgi:hypothetical protein